MDNNDLPLDFKKVIALLKERYKLKYPFIGDILNACRIKMAPHLFGGMRSYGSNAFDLAILISHPVYLKYFDNISAMETILRSDIGKSSSYSIREINTRPDYEKFEIVESEIITVLTEWEEINSGQSNLLDQLSGSTNSLDLQNIGNTARTILQQLSSIVYMDEMHKPDDPAISVTPINLRTD